MFRYLPEQASEIAPRVDFLNNLITDLSVFFTVAIVGAMLYFAVKYRQRGGVDHQTPRILGSHILEVVWTVVPTAIIFFILYYGVTIYRDMRQVPEGALRIGVWGQKWKWDFEYENGKQTTGKIYVPVDTPIQLVMKSRDVIHSVFLPEMRVKRDVLPGEYSYLTFKPIKTGVYPLYCTEYCGKDHWNMLAKLHVVSQAEYQQFLDDRSDELKLARMNPADLGRELFTNKGCNACHSLNGSPGVGPTWLKIYGREIELADGTKRKADENYLQQAILDPNSEIVKGYAPNLMPAFTGLLSDEELHGFIAFMKTIDGTQPEEEVAPAAGAAAAIDRSTLSPAERGQLLSQEKACSACHSIDGSKLVGPSFKGLYGRKGKLEGGADYLADDEYLKRSILQPMDQIVQGFAPAMPPYEGQLTDQDLTDLIEFMKTVK